MTAYQVGAQLESRPGERSATEAAYDRLVRELAAAGLDGDWRGVPREGRVELVGVLDAADAEDAVRRTVDALRAGSAAMGAALPGFVVRSLAAQPLDNPDDWAEPNGAGGT